MEKFQIFVKNLNNLWRFIEIYAVFVLNLCGEKMTNMRSDLDVNFGNKVEAGYKEQKKLFL